MIASAAALIAGWLAWSAVQVQIEAEERRAVADRIEVEEILKQDVDNFADGLAAIWRILDWPDEKGADAVNLKSADAVRLEGVIYGIGVIAKENWLSTARRMVTVLGWARRRRYEELFDGLEGLRRLRDTSNFDVIDALGAVRSLSYDFELVQPETSEYFVGLWRRPGKAWNLGYAIARYSGLSDEEAAKFWPPQERSGGRSG
jgi:hypothetical protein